LKKIKTSQTEIIISGAGVVGMTLAFSLAEHGIKTTIIDSLDIEASLGDVFDGRSYAISYAPYVMLKTLGLWDKIGHSAQPINEIHVTDGNCPAFLHFDEQELGDGPLGQMVEVRHIRAGLYGAIKNHKNINLIMPNKIIKTENLNGSVTITLEGGEEINSNLLIAAEGRGSHLRQHYEINIREWEYKQTGMLLPLNMNFRIKGLHMKNFILVGRLQFYRFKIIDPLLFGVSHLGVQKQ